MKLISVFAATIFAVSATARQNTPPSAAQTGSNHATLIIKSPTESVISIDGQGAYLVTPTRSLKWKFSTPGVHKITASTGAQRWSANVKVQAGKTQTVRAVLKPEKEQLYAPNITIDKSGSRSQQQYDQQLEECINYNLQQQRADAERARRAREIQSQYKTPKHKKKKKKIRRPKVH